MARGDTSRANDYLDGIAEQIEAGDGEPYVHGATGRWALDAIDAENWIDSIERGYTDVETATYLESFGINDPYEIQEIGLDYDGSWTLVIDGTEIELGDDLPSWVWDELYDLAADLDIEWWVQYAEAS